MTGHRTRSNWRGPFTSTGRILFTLNSRRWVPARPEIWPASAPTLAEFRRRVLFELPPGPPEKSKADEPDEGEKKVVTTKPIPARRAKLDAVETMRDLALGDAAFANGILPLLEEFMTSRGVSERAACLVAVTRIKKTLFTAEGT